MILYIFHKISGWVGVEWAPRDVPMTRRLQTLAAAAWAALILFGEALSVYLIIQLLYSRFWWAGCLYAAWMLNDIDVCNYGGRKSEWVRNWTWWRYYRDYFPLRLVKTAELDPTRNYLFGVFPHGVIACGAFGAFCTNALGFKEQFPGLTARLITLRGHFLVPFFRDLALALGVCASSRESISNLLDTHKHTGQCVCLLVGGAAEALHAHPGHHSVLLKKRKGFIRLAITHGAPLVPVFTFGEADVYHPLNNPEDSWLRRVQEAFKSWTGVSPVFPLGRGVFQYSVGLLPHRTPVTTVVGAPLEVERHPDPSPETVDAVHAEFTTRLQQLFEEHKHHYLPEPEKAKLIIS